MLSLNISSIERFNQTVSNKVLAGIGIPNAPKAVKTLR
jgi:hypothetical protein